MNKKQQHLVQAPAPGWSTKISLASLREQGVTVGYDEEKLCVWLEGSGQMSQEMVDLLVRVAEDLGLLNSERETLFETVTKLHMMSALRRSMD